MNELVSGEYTVQDYILANRLHLGKMKSYQACRIMGIVLLIPMIFFMIIIPKDVLGWFIIAFCLYFISYPYTVLPLRSKALFKQQKQIHGRVEVRFEGDQIISNGPLTEGSTKWLHHYVISDKIMLLYTTPRTFVMLPRRFFKDDAQFNEVKAFLQTFPTGNKMKP